MKRWCDSSGNFVTLAELDGDRLVLLPTSEFQAVLRALWIPCVFERAPGAPVEASKSMRVSLGRWHWPTVRSVLPVDLVAHVEAERPAWLAWVAREEGFRARRPVDPLAEVERVQGVLFGRQVGDAVDAVGADHPWHRLYPYQQVGVRWAREAGERGIIGDSMGLGKSAQASMVIERNSDTHRALIVCPGSLPVNWQREAATWAPSWTTSIAWSARDLQKLAAGAYQDRHATIVSWGLLSRPAAAEALRRVGYDAVIIDECFVPGTLIEARRGRVPIEEIVVGDEVLSFNVLKSRVEWRSVVTVFSIMSSTRLVRVTLSDCGVSFVCTEFHNIWTENRGYVHAGSLSGDDYVLRREVCVEDWCHSGECDGSIRDRCQGVSSSRESCLRVVPGALRGSEDSAEEILFKEVCCSVEDDNERGSSQCGFRREGAQGCGAREAADDVVAHAPEQSNDESGISREGDDYEACQVRGEGRGEICGDHGCGGTPCLAERGADACQDRDGYFYSSEEAGEVRCESGRVYREKGIEGGANSGESGSQGVSPRDADLCLVFGVLYDFENGFTEVLLKEVFCGMEGDDGGGARQHCCWREGRQGPDEGEASRCVTTHAPEQPDGESGDCGEDGEEVARSYVFVPRRERADHEAAADVDRCSRGVADGVRDFHGAREESVQEPSVLLQGGHCARGIEVGDRGGRSLSSKATLALSGSSEGVGLVCTRVASVALYEQGSGRGHARGGDAYSRVHDFEVEGNHNYFAEGVLVSNCHYAKSADAARTQYVVDLVHDASIRLLLSGTPIKSRPAEFWTLMHMIDPIRFHSFFPWGETFCGARDQFIGTRVVRTYKGSARLPALAKVTTPYLLRREKEDVLKDLPPKRRQILPVAASAALVAETEDLKQEIRDQALSKSAGGAALGKIGPLRKKIGLAKVPAAVEWAVQAHRDGEPTVLFIYHHEVAEALKAGLEAEGLRVGVITGETPVRARQAIVDAFQGGDLDALIGSEAIKEGISLVRSAFSCQVEWWWTPGDHDQAEDRLCRNKQLRSVLNVYLLLLGTFDVYVADLVDEKRGVVSGALNRDMFYKALLRRLEAA